MRLVAAWLVGCACALVTTIASAQQARPAPRPADLVVRAEAAFSAQRYDEAAALYQKLLDSDTSERTLFRTGESYRLAGSRRAAEFYLESYLTLFDRGEHAAEVRHHLEALRLEEVPPVVAQTPSPAAPAEGLDVRHAPARQPDGRRLRNAAIGVGVVALALGVGGAGVLVSVSSDYAGLERACALRPCMPDNWRSAQARAYAGYGVLAAAGVALLVDIPLWVLWSRTRRRVK